MSTLPPAARGTMMRIARWGYSAADCASATGPDPERTAERRIRASLILLPIVLCSTTITEDDPMSIAWNAFTPASALIGGAIIGAAAALFAVLNGRIAGVSGILGGLARPQAGDLSWRIAFVAGLVAAPLVWAFLAALPEIRVDSSYPALVAAGLLVGIGTRYGGGCTSGHGVCGVSRLSPRSIAATFAFMAAGFATVFVARHLIAP